MPFSIGIKNMFAKAELTSRLFMPVGLITCLKLLFLTITYKFSLSLSETDKDFFGNYDDCMKKDIGNWPQTDLNEILEGKFAIDYMQKPAGK